MNIKSFGAASLIVVGMLAGVACGVMAQDSAGNCQSRIIPPTAVEQAAEQEATRLRHEADQALISGNYAEAESKARQAIAADSFTGLLARQPLALALLWQGKDDEAFQTYQSMAVGGGNDPRVFVPYALLLIKQGRLTEAVSAYNQPLLAHGSIGGDLLHTYLQFSTDNLPQANDLEAALHLHLGIIYSSVLVAGTYSPNDRALVEFQRALALMPNSGLATYYYGVGLRNTGQTEKAKAVFQKAIRIGRSDVREVAQRDLDEMRKQEAFSATKLPTPMK